MKRLLVLVSLFVGLSALAFANGKGGDQGDELLRKSSLAEPMPFIELTSFPRLFAPIGNPKTSPAVSTGYYYVDSDEQIDSYWRPNYPSSYQDTTFQPNLWTRIVAGPRIVPRSFWDDNEGGYYFFRNPNESNFWTNPSDTTDDAIAGPMPLGLNGGFFFNGIRYDSFYVSTNGLVALTNRRYFYDEDGNRTIPPGAETAYDPMSMDWFVGGLREKDYETDEMGNVIIGEDGFPILRDGLTDPVRDDFGYLFSVLGNDPLYDPESGNPPPLPGAQGGIRRPGGGNINGIIPQINKTAIIAPFWGNLHLSQWDEEKERVDDHGRVYFKRNVERDELRISFFNAAPVGNMATPYGNYQADPDLRDFRPDEAGGDLDYIAADAQVLLDTKDSSVTILYRAFTGITSSTFRPAFSNQVFRCNTTAGVRGFARHINFNQGGVNPNDPLYPWAGEYPQYTHYFASYCTPDQDWPNASMALRFKQWQNTLRVADIRYRVRELDNEANLDFTVEVPSSEVENYELLAGEERLGAVQPIALIQNLSNDIQGPSGVGVNYVEQDLEFRARFVIENQITGRKVYNRIVPVDAFCMGLDDDEFQECTGDQSVRVRLAQEVEFANGNFSTTLYRGPDYKAAGFDGVPSYQYVEVSFPAWEANEFLDNHIGRHRAFIISVAQSPRSGDALGDEWPFDDTASVKLFVMRRLTDFNDDVTTFHVDRETGITIPNAFQWVNINAEVISGEAASRHPLPPRGEYGAENIPSRRVLSPVIKMNRVQLDGISEPDPAYADERGLNGDELRSFPIDMRGQFGAVLSLSVQRNIDRDDWVRGWSDSELTGPEPRVIANGNPFNVYAAGMATSSAPDELVVEFAKPSDDGLTEVTNIPLENWRHHPGRRGTDTELIEDMAALTIYGAGGYLIGFLESDRDSALAMPDGGNLAFNSLRNDIFDDGIDWEYKKYFIQIPDTFINWQRGGAQNFRFRLKTYATNDLKDPIIPTLPDDDDDFLVDNIRIAVPREVTDLEISAVKMVWPYTLAPASQADRIPIRVTVSNNTSLDAPPFAVKVKVFRTEGEGNNITVEEEPIYCRLVNIANLNANSTLEVDMPDWNARKSQVEAFATYRLEAEIKLAENEKDLIPSNDLTYTDVSLEFSDQFAYDPADDPTNSVPSEGSPANMPGGKGLNLFGSNWGGTGFNAFNDRVGAPAGSGSGQIAAKFTLLNTDTLRGFRAMFGNLNFAPDYITLAVHESGGTIPGDVIAETRVIKQRLIDDITGNLVAGAYVTYLIDPIELPRGEYWIAISQMGQDGLELAASASRSGMRVMNRYIAPDFVTLGTQGTVLNLDKNFRRLTPQGNYVNENFFAFENTLGSGNWVQFTPTVGNPAYAHLDHNGTVPVGDQTLTTGTWIPMIRPYFGFRTHGSQSEEIQWCPDDVVPVEMVEFGANVRKSGIDLYWATATEEQNSGFMIERRIIEDTPGEFQEIGFVSGAGNSSVIKRYNYTDRDVVSGTTYEYRLKQIDLDGTFDCNISQTVTRTFIYGGQMNLAQNQPNPVVNSTQISFTLPNDTDARLEILDIYGNLISTVAQGNMTAGTHNVQWDVTDQNGMEVNSGTYIYRLVAGENTLTGKMTVVK